MEENYICAFTRLPSPPGEWVAMDTGPSPLSCPLHPRSVTHTRTHRHTRVCTLTLCPVWAVRWGWRPGVGTHHPCPVTAFLGPHPLDWPRLGSPTPALSLLHIPMGPHGGDGGVSKAKPPGCRHSGPSSALDPGGTWCLGEPGHAGHWTLPSS